MSEKNLIICDSECSYVNFLMENILEREELSVGVRACTSWEKAKTFLEERPADMLLVEETWKDIARNTAGVGQVILLTKEKHEDTAEGEKKIYKYQCADTIVATLFEKENVFHTVRETKQRILAVYSPIHRAGKTTFAISLGKELAKRRKVLYLNLEEYPGFDSGYVDGSREDLGDLLYYLKQDCVSVGLRVGAMVQQDGKLEYLLPVPLCSDLKEVTVEEWKQLLENIQETGYETIVMDIGESVQGLYEILTICDKIYMPVLGDEVSQMKLACYERNLRQQGLARLLHKTRKMEMEGGNIDETAGRIAREDFGGIRLVKGD